MPTLMLEVHNYTSFFITEWGRWGLAAQNISSIVRLTCNSLG